MLRPASRNTGSMARQIASKAFMSQLPRPNSLPSFSRNVNGSLVQLWPLTGTVSVWPESRMPPSTFGPTVAKIAALSPSALGTRVKAMSCSTR